jgi:hypothetical protein
MSSSIKIELDEITGEYIVTETIITVRRYKHALDTVDSTRESIYAIFGGETNERT